MKTKFISLLVLLVFSMAGRPNANMVLTPELDSYNHILADWKKQDNVESNGYSQALGQILSGLPDDVATPFKEDKQTLEAGSPTEGEWEDLYIRVCSKRRGIRLEPYLDHLQSIVYCSHSSPGEVFGNIGKSPAGKLRAIEINGLFGETRQIYHGSKSCRTPDVSYDGKRILFSARTGKADEFRLFEMNLADSSVRQITYGYEDMEDVADLEGIYLPNGNIMFVSSRMIQAVDCFGGVVYNLFLCDGDGNYIRRIGFDQSPTNYPQVLPTGEVVYSRWDYNDKSHIYGHALFVMKPDGTTQQEYYNNNSWWPSQILQARPIPNTNKIMAMIGGYHSKQHGEIGIIDNSVGRQNGEGLLLLAPKRLPKDDTLEEWGTRPSNYRWDPPEGFDPTTFVKPGAWPLDSWGQKGPLYSFPYPFDEEAYLVCRNSQLFFMYADGRREMLSNDRCASPVPVRPRPVDPIPASTVDYRDSTGVFVVSDVYEAQSPIMDGVERGTIKKIRVLALEYRAQQRLSKYGMPGPARINDGGATVSDPTAMNGASWDLKRVIGETPVHSDGSAAFIVPAREPVFFQLIDEHGQMVQTMRSWATLQPGEEFACVGCHESRLHTPTVPGNTIAQQSPPRELEPFYGPPRGFSFAKEIQPILDAKCVECHNDNIDNGIDLRGVPSPDNVRNWSLSYKNLVDDGYNIGANNSDHVHWCYAESAPTYQPPYRCGSSKSPLVKLLREGHEEVVMTKEEMEKLCCWIDIGIQFAGEYSEAMSADRQAKYAQAEALRAQWEEDERANIQGYLGQTTAAHHQHRNETTVNATGIRVRRSPMGFTVTFRNPTLNSNEKIGLRLYTLRGELVFSGNHDGSRGGMTTMRIDNRSVGAHGNYLIAVEQGDRRYAQKMVVLGR